MESPKTIEEEVRDDMNKTSFELLANVHTELLHSGRSPTENIAHALKRLASTHVKAAEESLRMQSEMAKMTRKFHAYTKVQSRTNDRLGKQMKCLTIIGAMIAGLALVLQFADLMKWGPKETGHNAAQATVSMEPTPSSPQVKVQFEPMANATPSDNADKEKFAPPEIQPAQAPQNSPKEVKPLEPKK